MTKPTTKKRGRPRKADAVRRRKMVGVRLRDKTLARIVKAAAKEGRSLSQEIEHRVEKSFGSDAIVSALDRINDRMFTRSAAQGYATMIDAWLMRNEVRTLNRDRAAIKVPKQPWET